MGLRCRRGSRRARPIAVERHRDAVVVGVVQDAPGRIVIDGVAEAIAPSEAGASVGLVLMYAAPHAACAQAPSVLGSVTTQVAAGGYHTREVERRA